MSHDLSDFFWGKVDCGRRCTGCREGFTLGCGHRRGSFAANDAAQSRGEHRAGIGRYEIDANEKLCMKNDICGGAERGRLDQDLERI